MHVENRDVIILKLVILLEILISGSNFKILKSKILKSKILAQESWFELSSSCKCYTGITVFEFSLKLSEYMSKDYSRHDNDMLDASDVSKFRVPSTYA